ncbi:unnamed protein product [Moneuplotes crassus]|uniref:Uncharacterized protein n=1 Tax=Euplotes crassus TaxID=5936 RepID=A0AAD1XU56_EUPCR|nr:unnamed protein product [Moneuplotes crassus]
MTFKNTVRKHQRLSYSSSKDLYTSLPSLHHPYSLQRQIIHRMENPPNLPPLPFSTLHPNSPIPFLIQIAHHSTLLPPPRVSF